MSPGMIVHSTVFSIVSNSSDSCTKLKRIVTFNLLFFQFFSLLKFDLNEDKLELEYLISNLITKRDLRFDIKDVCRKLERFHVG